MRPALFALLLPTAAHAETEVLTSSGDNATLTSWEYSEDGCTVHWLDLTVSETMSHSTETHGGPTGSLAGWISYGYYSWCDVEIESWEGPLGEDAVFWVAPSGRSATLEATVELTHWIYTDGSSETVLADVEVAWTAISASYPSMYVSKYSGAWESYYSRTHSISRDATVSGTFFDIELGSLDAWAAIGTSSSGEFFRFTY